MHSFNPIRDLSGTILEIFPIIPAPTPSILPIARIEDLAEKCLQKLQTLMRSDLNNYLELALDYAHAGFFAEARAAAGRALIIDSSN